jgi:hypothetical protein
MNNNKHSSKLENIKQQIEAAKKVKSEELAKALLCKAFKLRKLVLAMGLIACLSACGLQVGPVKFPDGFAFSVGVNNVNQVLDKKGLYVENLKANKMEGY